jgi:hypothetical protein
MFAKNATFIDFYPFFPNPTSEIKQLDLEVALPSQWCPAPARLYAYQSLLVLQIAQIPEVSSKEGAVLGTRKFRGVITDIRHMNNC